MSFNVFIPNFDIFSLKLSPLNFDDEYVINTFIHILNDMFSNLYVCLHNLGATYFLPLFVIKFQ